MKSNTRNMMLSLLLFSSANFAQDTLSIKQAVNWVDSLEINTQPDLQKLSVTLNQISEKDSFPIIHKTEHLKSVMVTGSGYSHKYVQNNFVQNKIQQSMVPEEHLIESLLANNQLNIPFKSFHDEMLTLNWEHKNDHQQTINIYSTWLINPENGNQFTEKTSALSSIRPLVSSALLVKGNDFPVRLYHQFGALKGHELEAIHIESKMQVKAFSDSQGIAVLNLSQAGDWLLMIKHERQDKQADLTSYALLNFHVKRGEQ